MTTAREPRTHNFGPGRRRWGHDYTFKPIDGGQKGTATGWGWDGNGIEVGDYLLLQNGDRDSRYRVDEIKRHWNTDDMWTVKLTFAPRKTAAT